MLKTKFTFDFYLEDFNQDNQRYSFIINYSDNDYDLLYDMSQHDEYLDFLSDIEGDYGVHDFVTTGDDQLFGYDTYEVEPKRINSVMNKWREFFINKGYNCDPIFQEEYQSEK